MRRSLSECTVDFPPTTEKDTYTTVQEFSTAVLLIVTALVEGKASEVGVVVKEAAYSYLNKSGGIDYRVNKHENTYSEDLIKGMLS